MANYSFFGVNGNGATGPASSASYTGPFVSGHTFTVTQAGQSLLGYYVWRADSSQAATCTMALWTVTAISTGTFQTGTNVTSGTMTVGQWNYIPLATPFPLTNGGVYRMVYGAANNFSDTTNQFGSGDAYPAGITNGPINLYGDQAHGGTNLAPYSGSGNAYQGVFSTAGSDPTTTLPSTPDTASNFWIDVLVGPASSAPPVTAALPGPTWQRRFKHRQILASPPPQAVTATAAVATVSVIAPDAVPVASTATAGVAAVSTAAAAAAIAETAAAGVATVPAVAPQPQAAITVNAGVAAVLAVATAATAGSGTTANAGVAAVSVIATAATVAETATAGVAAVLAVAPPGSAAVTATAGAAAVAVTAPAPSVAASATAGAGAVQAAAATAPVAIVVNAGVAAVLAVAPAATVNTSGSTNAVAAPAAVLAIAAAPSPAIVVTAGVATVAALATAASAGSGKTAAAGVATVAAVAMASASVAATATAQAAVVLALGVDVPPKFTVGLLTAGDGPAATLTASDSA